MAEEMNEKVPIEEPATATAPATTMAAEAGFTDGSEGEPEGGFVKDGIRVHPQPTSDPLDPLNWSPWRKHSILAIVMFNYFMFTYITTTTVPSFPQIQTTLNISVGQVNWTVAIPALGLALGPLVWSSLADIYGRRIIFIIGTIISLAASLGAAGAKNYGGYMAARFFQGFGVSPAATVGLAAINDLYFDYERGWAVGLWVLAIDSGLLVGPLIGGFVDLVSEAFIDWFTAILFGVLLAAEIAFMPETLYPRNRMLQRMPMLNGAAGEGDAEKSGRRLSAIPEDEVKRTKELPFINVKPVPGMRHPKPWDSVVRFLLSFRYLAVTIAVLTYCFAWYWWVLSIITLIPVAYIQYSPQIQGLLFIGLLLGTWFSEAFCSGHLSDRINVTLAKRNNNIVLPEMRLWLVYPAATSSAIGLILWGISVDKAYHWIVGQIAFFLFAAGIQMGNTAICAYIVDCYPLQSMSVITFYSVFLNLSAFINPFFISPWETKVGFTWTFATQGILTFFISVPVIAALHKFGGRIRQKTGHPSWVNPEFDSHI